MSGSPDDEEILAILDQFEVLKSDLSKALTDLEQIKKDRQSEHIGASNEMVRLYGLLRVATVERQDAEKRLADAKADAARHQYRADNLLRPMRDKAVARLEFLLRLYVGCKWADAGPLIALRPDDEKYITRESLLAEIDAELKDQP